MKSLSGISGIVLGVVFFCVTLYYGYWVAKTISYVLFYETKVENTIRDMVKQEALK